MVIYLTSSPLRQPPLSGLYTIGVHYADDQSKVTDVDLGSSTATVRVFDDGDQIAEFSAVLDEDDMWDVGRLDLESREVWPSQWADGSPVISSCFCHPSMPGSLCDDVDTAEVDRCPLDSP